MKGYIAFVKKEFVENLKNELLQFVRTVQKAFLRG